MYFVTSKGAQNYEAHSIFWTCFKEHRLLFTTKPNFSSPVRTLSFWYLTSVRVYDCGKTRPGCRKYLVKNVWWNSIQKHRIKPIIFHRPDTFKTKFNKGEMILFFICYLLALRPTLGHYRGTASLIWYWSMFSSNFDPTINRSFFT